MHFEKTSKQFTEFLQKLGSKKTKAPIDLKPATTLENLFKRFLFILEPSVVHQKVNSMGKNQFNHHKRRQTNTKKNNSSPFIFIYCQIIRSCLGQNEVVDSEICKTRPFSASQKQLELRPRLKHSNCKEDETRKLPRLESLNPPKNTKFFNSCKNFNKNARKNPY